MMPYVYRLINHERRLYLSNYGVVERCDIVKDSIDSLESIDGRVHLSIDTIIRLVVVLQWTAYFPVCLTLFSYLILLILLSKHLSRLQIIRLLVHWQAELTQTLEFDLFYDFPVLFHDHWWFSLFLLRLFITDYY